MPRVQKNSRVEKLDRRLMLSAPEGGLDWTVVGGKLTFRGGAGDDVLTIDVENPNFVLTHSGVSETVPIAGILSLELRGGAGNDEIRIDRNRGLQTQIFGEADNDLIVLAHSTHNLDRVDGPVNVLGGTGDDEIRAEDGSNDQPDTYVFDAIDLTRDFFIGVVYQIDVERVRLIAANALNTMNVNSVETNTEFHFENAGGADVINLGRASNGLNSFRNNVYIDSSAGLPTVNINDGPSNVARNIRLGNDTGYSRVDGVQPTGSIFIDSTEVSPTNLTTGSAADTIVVAGAGNFVLNSSNGLDTVRLGDDIPGSFGMDGVAGTFTINNTPSFTTIIYDDSLSGVPAETTFEVESGYTKITDAGGNRTIRFNNTDVDDVTVLGTPLDDIYRFIDVANTTRLSSGWGGDNVFVDNITSGGTMTVNTDGSEFDELKVNEGGVGTAQVMVDQNDSVREISIGTGGNLTLKQGANVVYEIASSDAWDGIIDITDNTLLRLDTSFGGPGFLIGQLANGYNGGAWNATSNAIVSSTAASNAIAGDSVGYALKPDTSFTTLGGFMLEPSSLIIRYTLQGDANLDRTVNFADLLRVAQSYNQNGKSWAQGNFNFDALAKVDFNDVLLLAQKYGVSVMQARRPASIGRSILNSREDDKLFA